MHLGLKIKNLGGIIPEWKNLSDAGLDLHVAVDTAVPGGQQCLIPLGFATEFPNTYVAIIKDRSGMALRGIYTHGGIIDSCYRGEWKAMIENTRSEPWLFKRGERIAQVIFLPVFHLHIEEVTKLGDSIRGSGGFGSTGS
jgi:dUTP pyrophosphatase